METETNRIETLGKRSSFEYYYKKKKLFIRFGKSKNFIEVPFTLIELVKQRVESAKDFEKLKTSYYNQPNWKECTNNRMSPYIACLIIKKMM
jgi:hypothetical protein